LDSCKFSALILASCSNYAKLNYGFDSYELPVQLVVPQLSSATSCYSVRNRVCSVNEVPKLRLLLCFIPHRPVKLIYHTCVLCAVSLSVRFVGVELYRRLIF